MPYFKSHGDSARTLYRQRDQFQKQPLIEAHFIARQEQLLFTHLHVLAHSEKAAAEPGEQVETFVCLMQQLLSPLRNDANKVPNRLWTVCSEQVANNKGRFTPYPCCPKPVNSNACWNSIRIIPRCESSCFNCGKRNSVPCQRL